MAEKDIDAVSGVETTGHEWDGIKELNNPLPKWWLRTWQACIIWGLAYTVFYPAWPFVEGATKGVLGYTNRGAVAEEIAAHKASQSVWLDQIKAADLETIDGDEGLRQFAVAGGAAAFKVNCSQCHGAGAGGAKGYPNLTDDDWLWGGDLQAIHDTIAHGVRNGTDEARLSEMPRFGADDLLDKAQIADVTQYVLSLTTDADAAAAGRGAEVFAENCTSCHGENAEGMRDLGAPALNDAIWLFGGDAAAIAAQISAPRHGVMPAWGQKLDETTIKQLAVYVHSLGGGE